MATTTTARRARKLGKVDLAKLLNGQGERAMHLDLVGTAEAAEEILGVERARIGKWRRKGILLSNGERIAFPEPITVVTTCAKDEQSGEADHTKLAATPLWWADDIRALAKKLARNRPRD